MPSIDPVFRSLNKVPRLSRLVREGLVKKRTLVEVHKNRDLQPLNWEYLSDPKYAADTLTTSTVLYYPNGDVMAVFLKGDLFKSSRASLTPLIPESIRDRAFEGLSQIPFKRDGFEEPSRRPTKGAVDWNHEAKELLFGYMDAGSIDATRTTTKYEEPYDKVMTLVRLMNGIFARMLPKEYAEAGRHKLSRAEFRAGGTPFSTVTVNRNCPTGLHKDTRNHPGLIAMTTLAAPGTTGGAFCFPQYALKVPVKPGDLLIAATSREWHCNLSPVVGLKFSVVCYRRKLSNAKMLRTYDIKQGEKKIDKQRKIRPKLP
jgi:hypothetical protein